MIKLGQSTTFPELEFFLGNCKEEYTDEQCAEIVALIIDKIKEDNEL